jgi:UDP-glucose 4-epimerase
MPADGFATGQEAEMILVTGGFGFIGSHVTRALLDAGEPCVLLRHRTGAVPGLIAGELGGQLSVAPGDVTDLATLREAGDRHKITGIVHLAGGFGLDASDPIGGAADGVAGLLNVLRVAMDLRVPRVGVASTIGVYDGPGDSPLREDLPLPMTAAHPIPVAKKVHELIGGYVANATGVEVYFTRIAAAWGPLGRPASRFFAAPQLVHTAVRGLAPLSPAPFAGDGIDMIYVRDCGRAIALLQLAGRLSHRVYNVGSGRPTSNAELAAAIGKAVSGARIELRDGRDPAGPGRDVYLDITRIRTDTGFHPGYGTGAAVADYVSWLRAGNER